MTIHKRQPEDGTERPYTSRGIEAISNEIYGDSAPQADHVHFLSAEDEYALLDEVPEYPTTHRSYGGAICYASLLWDREPPSTPITAGEKTAKNQGFQSNSPTLPLNRYCTFLFQATFLCGY